MPTWYRALITALLGALATATLASGVQTQLNLHELALLGMHIEATTRLRLTGEDLLRFGPVMLGFALCGGIFALTLQAALRRLRWHALPCALLAAVLGLAVVLALLRSVIPMPAIAATRSLAGLALLSLCGLGGGYVSWQVAQWSALGSLQRSRWLALLTAAVLVLPVLSFVLMRPMPQSPAPVAAEGYQVLTVAEGLDHPWSLAELPDGRLLVTEMAGRLKLITHDGQPREVDLSHLPTSYHRGRTIGLMDVALSPAFERDGHVYLTQGYRDPRGVGVRLLRGRLQAHLSGSSLQDVEVLFESTPKSKDSNNGGRVAFLDDDTLLLTVGDGSARREEAQNPHSSLGKVMRIDLRTPDATSASRSAHAAVIHTRGHRNPQGIARDPASGAIYLTEHGPRGGDELNRLHPGANYGWPLVSHGIDYPFARVSPFTRMPGLQDPELVWTPSIAPSGLAIYQGTLFKGWAGDLLVSALRERGIRRVVRDGEKIVRQELLLGERNERIRDVRVAADGSLYALTDGGQGKLLRLRPQSLPAGPATP